MVKQALLYGLVAERFTVGAAAWVAGSDSSLSARMFGVRHLALGAALFSVRRDDRLLRQVAAINAGVEFADAAAMLASSRRALACGALIGGIGCAALAWLARPGR